MKDFREILEAKKMNASGIVKLFKNTSEWGDDLYKQVKVVKGNLQYIDSVYIGRTDKLEAIIKDWTTPNGFYAKYFKDNYGISFKVVATINQIKAEGKFKKFTKDGVVGVELKVV